MKWVFVSGSINITKLPGEVIASIDKIEQQQFEILVGDAKGIDLLVQQKLKDDGYRNVMVCSIYQIPRHLLEQTFQTCQVEYDDSITSERQRQTFKDSYMTRNSDYSLVVWDGRSKGSFSNIIRALEHDKAVKIYLDAEARFLEQSEVTKENIEKIYKNNTGYTATEIIKMLGHSKIVSAISSVKEFKDFLVRSHYLQQKGNQVMLSEQYSEYFIVENYRGKTNIRFKDKVLELVERSSLF